MQSLADDVARIDYFTYGNDLRFFTKYLWRRIEIRLDVSLSKKAKPLWLCIGLDPYRIKLQPQALD